MEEARVEPVAMVMRRRMLEWFGHVKEEMKQKTSKQLQKWGWREESQRKTQVEMDDTVRRDLKAWKIREEWANSCIVLYGTLQNRLVSAVGWRPMTYRVEDRFRQPRAHTARSWPARHPPSSGMSLVGLHQPAICSILEWCEQQTIHGQGEMEKSLWDSLPRTVRWLFQLYHDT